MISLVFFTLYSYLVLQYGILTSLVTFFVDPSVNVTVIVTKTIIVIVILNVKVNLAVIVAITLDANGTLLVSRFVTVSYFWLLLYYCITVLLYYCCYHNYKDYFLIITPLVYLSFPHLACLVNIQAEIVL